MLRDDQISPIQMTVILISVMFGVGILTLPRVVAQTVGTPDAWMAVLFAGGIGIVQASVIGKLCAVFPRQDFFAFSQLILGRPISVIITLLFVLEYLLVFAYESRVMGAVVRQYLLDRTPLEVIVLIMLFASAYLVAGGVGPLVRINQLFLPIILFFVAIGVLLGFQNFDAKNALPLFRTGFKPLLDGTIESAFSFLGFEIMLFLSVYLQKPEKVLGNGVLAVVVVSISTTVIVFLAIGVFGVQPLSRLTWGGLEIVRNIEIPKGLIERTESVFLTVWIMAIFTTVSLTHFVSSLLVGQILNKHWRSMMYWMLPVAYIISMTPKSLIEVFQLGNYLSYLGLFLNSVVPTLLLVVAKVRRVGTHAKE